MVVVEEIACRSVLSRSGIPTVDYSVNPYVGCFHKCIYCYARFMKRFSGHQEPWGEFVDVKTNAPQVLSQELARASKGIVNLSSVTDPYQPLEKKYELTRKCLERLLMYKFPVVVQTKSSLVLRDIKVLAKFPECEVGFTVTTVDDEVRKKSERRSSPVEERLAALKELHDQGVSTYAFLGPILPYITDGETDLVHLFEGLAEAEVDRIIVDRLNMRWGVWASVVRFLNEHYPDLVAEYRRVFWSRNDYFQRLKSNIAKLCDRYELDCEFCF